MRLDFVRQRVQPCSRSFGHDDNSVLITYADDNGMLRWTEAQVWNCSSWSTVSGYLIAQLRSRVSAISSAKAVGKARWDATAVSRSEHENGSGDRKHHCEETAVVVIHSRVIWTCLSASCHRQGRSRSLNKIIAQR